MLPSGTEPSVINNEPLSPKEKVRRLKADLEAAKNELEPLEETLSLQGFSFFFSFFFPGGGGVRVFRVYIGLRAFRV